MKGFEELEHTADRSFRVRGCDLRELLENAAQAMTGLDEQGPGGGAQVVHEVEIQGADRETLLVNWLNEILYLEQTRAEVYDQFQVVEVGENHLRARLHGRRSTDSVTHIKAATFHNLQVKQTSEGLEATVVVDV